MSAQNTAPHLLFRSEQECAIDTKGRVSFPARFREVLDQHGDSVLYITRYDQCLHIYPSQEWYRIENLSRRMPFTDPNVAAFKRFFFAPAQEATIDAQGRIMISNPLREYARLEKEVVFAGNHNFVELWNRDIWHQVVQSAGANFNNLLEYLNNTYHFPLGGVPLEGGGESED